jgi:hypothetical protein
MKTQSTKIAALALVTALAIASCGGGEETVAPQDMQVSDSTLWPLTQLPGPQDATSQPVLAIKVEDDQSVRPQYGLDGADLVVEELVEGGITRFVSFFQSTIPDEVGPIRSARHVDASIVSPLADYFVVSGASGVTLAYLDQSMPINIVRVYEGGDGIHRTNYHSAPHNLFVYPMDIIASNKAAKSETAGLFKRPDAMGATPAAASVLTDGESVTAVKLEFSKGKKPSWSWDSAKGVWLRNDGSKPHMAISGNQLSAKNLVVLRVTTVDAGYKDPAGGYVPRTVLEGTGAGFAVLGDKKIPVTWSKADVKAQIVLTDSAGSVVGLLPGNTWVELIPTEGDVSFVAGSASAASPSASPSASK